MTGGKVVEKGLADVKGGTSFSSVCMCSCFYFYHIVVLRTGLCSQWTCWTSRALLCLQFRCRYAATPQVVVVSIGLLSFFCVHCYCWVYSDVSVSVPGVRVWQYPISGIRGI